MFDVVLGWIAIALVGLGSPQTATAQAPEAGVAPAAHYREILDRYCVTCHNEKLRTAGLSLEKIDAVNVAPGAEIWEKVLRKLQTGAMPPAGMPRPDKTIYNAFASYLEGELDHSAAAMPNPGRPALYRLNRSEFINAVRDLLAIEVKGELLLPPDNADHGFDNIADDLSVSPALLERYMSAARKIARQAIGDPGIGPSTEIYKISNFLMQGDRTDENLPLGTRGVAVRHDFPLDGEYRLRILLRREDFGQTDILGISRRSRLDVFLDGVRMTTFNVGGEEKGKTEAEVRQYRLTADEPLEIRFSAKAGSRVIALAFLKPNNAVAEGIAPPPPPFSMEIFPSVASVSISGPYDATGVGDTPSRRKIFVCYPTRSRDEEPCARTILGSLARRAYRRPVTADDVRYLVELYRAGRSDGGFEEGIEMALEGLLASPDFLFRAERTPANVPPGTVYRISDLDLASRLSFFLWSSIPDDELLGLAENRKLSDPLVLEKQVRRMLADGRSKDFVRNFAGQWLYLRNIAAVIPDGSGQTEGLGEFPDFDENLREAMRRETELFVESIITEDRSVLDLLNANYTFLNERLARHYQIPNVYGSQFRRVTLNDDTRRGLLGQGSILTVTSYANRTSPTLRGKWLLQNLLGTPPPPPPPNVPPLKEQGSGDKVLTMRQRLEQHRVNPACASCHQRMDPLGFALENFDAIGKFRSTEANVPIDTSATLPDGTKLGRPAELRELLLSRSEEFVGTVTEKLITYALGRGVAYYDEPAIRKVVRYAANNNYRWSYLVLGIVRSVPFQMRRSPER